MSICFFLLICLFLCLNPFFCQAFSLSRLIICIQFRRPCKVWDISSLPVHDDRLADIIYIRISSSEQLSSLFCNLLDEVISVCPCINPKYVSNMLLLNPVKNSLNEIFWIWDFLSSNYSFEHLVCIRFTSIINDSWVDEVPLPHGCLNAVQAVFTSS